MTQEELDLLKELQPVIRKNMGCAEIGDNAELRRNGAKRSDRLER
jgi:hypothetical protein